jgi:PAS domain S-box-containing protein
MLLVFLTSINFQNSIIIFMLLLLVGLGVYLFIIRNRNNKYYQKSNLLIVKMHQRIQELQNQMLEESQQVDIHREELLTQTEHLQDLNVELERLSFVASETDTAVLIANSEGRFTWVNQGFIKLFGYTFREFIREVGSDIYSVGTVMNIKALVEKAVNQKQALSFTATMKAKNGEMRWVKTTFNPILDIEKKIKQYVILQTDVSELKLVNDKLKKLSMVASKTSSSVLIFDGEGELDWTNDSFHKMYGYSRHEYIEKYGSNLKDFCKWNIHPELCKKLTDKTTSHSFVSSVTNKDGKIIWKQTTVTPVLNDQQEIINYIVVESDITQIKEAEQQIQAQKEISDQLLLNILPAETAEELKTKGKATPRLYRSVSVMFADIVDFTKWAENLTPEELVEVLQGIFSEFDEVVGQFYLEKIKTIGDAFLCAGGLPMRNKSHPFDTVLTGLKLQRIIRQISQDREAKGLRGWQLRVGIHTGPVVAGVVGKNKIAYDIWGDSVNIAKRIESACVPGMVNVSASTYEIIKDFFECEYRGKILAKHKGHIDMYFVYRLKPEFSEEGKGIVPNNYFREMLARL